MKKLSVLNSNDVKEVNVDSIMRNLIANDAQQQIDKLIATNTVSRNEVESFVEIVKSDCKQKISEYVKELKADYDSNRNNMKVLVEQKKQNAIDMFTAESIKNFSINTKEYFIKLHEISMKYNKESYEESCKLVKKYNEDYKEIIEGIKTKNNFRIREFVKLHMASGGIA